MEINWKKGIPWIAGTVVLGAIGSGIWEIALKPGLIWVLDEVWSGLENAFTVAVNNNYLQIAIGNINRLDIFIFSGLAGVGAGLIINVAGSDINSVGKALSTIRTPFAKKVIIAMISGILISIGLKSIYIIGKINDYEQLYSIATPYVTQIEADHIRSSFSLMRTIEEYDNLMNKMISKLPKDLELPVNIEEYRANN